MKCPDVEQLMLFVDGELTASEATVVRSHIATCKSCQHEVKEFQADLETEALLRNKVNNSFAKHEISSKIMTAVKAEPKHCKKSSNTSVWSNWLVRLLVPAFAMAIVLFMLFSGTTKTENPVIYQGKVFKVSVFTNNSESFVDSVKAEGNKAFNLEPMTIKKIDGDFLVNVVSNSKNYSLVVEGKTEIKFDENLMELVFDNCNANITLVNGNPIKVNVNGQKINITKEKGILLKPEVEKEISVIPEKPKAVIEEKPVQVEKEEVVASSSPEVLHIESVIVEEESLTTSGTGDITILDISGEGEDVEESHSPFEDSQLGGM